MDNKHEDKVATSEETEINKSEFLEKAVSQETKSQVAQILSNIKSNAQAFEQLKQESPEVYQNLVDMTQSLVEIFSQDKEEQHKQLERTLKLIHVKLKEKQKKKIEDQIKFIDKKLGQFQQDKKDEDKEKHMKLIKDRMKQLREDDKKAKSAAKALGFQDMWKLFKIHGRK